MKIYLDTCSLNRPLDDKSLARNALEATAVLAILAACEQARVTLVSSDMLVFENEQNPHPQRRTFVAEVLKTAPDHIALSDAITQRAQLFVGQGVKAIDALHLAAAEVATVDYFCTCDDRLLRRARTLPDLQLKPVSPIEFIQEVAL
jgi:PIN domain-containing protein